ncbi:MAG: VOC family protein [Gammaproteobacteria bacterium]
MITRFDHAVIGVPDLAASIDAFAALGFDVAAGGRHPGLGTVNAIIRFGLDYLELLAVEDADEARAAGAFGADLLGFLERGPGLVGFVLASDGLDGEAAALAAIGQAASGPFDMGRDRPDGRRLDWRLVIPDGSPWRRPWPFLIEWRTPDAERLRWDAPGRHVNGVTGVAGLELLVADLRRARTLYERGLGLSPAEAGGDAVRYVLGDFALTVRVPQDATEVAELQARGPGPHRLLLARGGSGAATELDPADALGARIRLG